LTRVLAASFAQKKDRTVDLPTQIEERLLDLGTSSADVDEQFVRGTGPGGQKINKVSSTVLLRHRPSGTEVRCQQERSQSANRRVAWEALCEKLETLRIEARAAAKSAREKERRRKRTKSPAQKKRMVEDKRHRGQTKSRRGKIGDD
jgi:peptide chain release factor